VRSAMVIKSRARWHGASLASPLGA
jgi:hypothetical protein